MCKACESIVGARSQPKGSAASSSNNNNNNRFNLQIPPVAAIRSILSQNRLQLRVAPLRMDVYYQHADGDDKGKRELLERWCWEYAPAPPEAFLQAEGLVSSDPMVQLTHVCKRIVVWLRVLYCRTRLLPAQSIASTGAVTNVGFSVYVHTDMTDDVGELLGPQSSGAFCLLQPRKNSASVTTPYGTLSWQVVYATELSHLLPQPKSIRIQTTPTTNTNPSRPIPVSRGLKATTSMQQPTNMILHSAPTTTMHQQLSFVERSRRKHELHQQKQQLYHQHSPEMGFGKSLDRSRNMMMLKTTQQNTVPPPSSSPIALSTRANQEGTGTTSAQNTDDNDGDEKPERVLSALSLALLNTTAGADSGTEKHPSHMSEEEGVLVEQEPFRRAALHEVPSHWDDYGYAYNQQIPWQKLQKQQQQCRSSPESSSIRSTEPPVGTPPTAAFLGASPPPSALSSRHTSPTTTPPFTRPVGFFLSDTAASSIPTMPEQPPPEASSKPARNAAITTTMLPSLDALRQSPFDPRTGEDPAPPTTDPPYVSPFALPPQYYHNSTHSTTTSLLYPSAAAAAATRDVPDLPFAVVDEDRHQDAVAASSLLSSFHATPQAASSKLLAASAATTTTVDELQQQLQDFKTFGASLLVMGDTDGSSGEAG